MTRESKVATKMGVNPSSSIATPAVGQSGGRVAQREISHTSESVDGPRHLAGMPWTKVKRIERGLEVLESFEPGLYEYEVARCISRILRKYRSIRRPSGNAYLMYLYAKRDRTNVLDPFQ